MTEVVYSEVPKAEVTQYNGNECVLSEGAVYLVFPIMRNIPAT